MPAMSKTPKKLSDVIGKPPDIPHHNKEEPVWRGPISKHDQGGITSSLLSRYLVDGERFRLQTMLGLRRAEGFSSRTFYGDIWHVAEEALASGAEWKDIEFRMSLFASATCKKHLLQQEDVAHWYNVCKTQFPFYVEYWKNHPDVQQRIPILEEHPFDIPYQLPSRRVVRLRGKWDSVDKVGSGKNAVIVLQENKTKGDIDEEKVKRHLSSGYELQTSLYLTALTFWINERCQDDPGTAQMFDAPLTGVRYSVTRRPLSGGKGTIRKSEGTKGVKCRKCNGTGRWGYNDCPKCGGAGRIGGTPPETDEEFYARLGKYIEDDPAYFFMRWQVDIQEQDILNFQQRCLTPILENLCDDYEWWLHCFKYPKTWSVWDMDARAKAFPLHRKRHYLTPYFYNPLAQDREGDLDEFIRSGSEVGLTKVDNLFPELS